MNSSEWVGWQLRDDRQDTKRRCPSKTLVGCHQRGVEMLSEHDLQRVGNRDRCPTLPCFGEQRAHFCPKKHRSLEHLAPTMGTEQRATMRASYSEAARRRPTHRGRIASRLVNASLSDELRSRRVKLYRRIDEKLAQPRVERLGRLFDEHHCRIRRQVICAPGHGRSYSHRRNRDRRVPHRLTTSAES